MGPDHGIEEHVGPKAQHAKRIRVDGTAEDARQRIVGGAERQHREPHPHGRVHVVALNHHVPHAALVERQIGSDIENRQPTECAEDVPVGDVHLGQLARANRAVDVVAVEHHAKAQEDGQRPHPLAVFLGSARPTSAERHHATEDSRVPKPKGRPGEGRAPEWRARGAGYDIECKADKRHRAPAPEHGARVNRAYPSVGKPRNGKKVGPVELDRRDETRHGPHEEPDRGPR